MAYEQAEVTAMLPRLAAGRVAGGTAIRHEGEGRHHAPIFVVLTPAAAAGGRCAARVASASLRWGSSPARLRLESPRTRPVAAEFIERLYAAPGVILLHLPGTPVSDAVTSRAMPGGWFA